MIQKIKQLVLRYYEGLSYLFFGGLATLLNIFVFWLFNEIFTLHYTAANVIAWIVAVLFAYYTNSRWVFTSYRRTSKEFSLFIVGRLISLGCEMLILFVMVDLLYINELIAKIVSNLFVIIFNYVFSKLIVFRQTKKENQRTGKCG